MARNTTFTCDRCEHTQRSDRKFRDDDRWMRTIRIDVFDGDMPEGAIRHANIKYSIQSLWCDKCLGEFDTHRLTSRPDGQEAPATPTFEEVLRAVIGEEIIRQVGR